jgi:hypothetical protein
MKCCKFLQAIQTLTIVFKCSTRKFLLIINTLKPVPIICMRRVWQLCGTICVIPLSYSEITGLALATYSIKNSCIRLSSKLN